MSTSSIKAKPTVSTSSSPEPPSPVHSTSPKDSRLFLSSCVQLKNPWPSPNKFSSLEACAKRISDKDLPADHILWRDSFDSPKDGKTIFDVNPHSGRKAAWIEYPGSLSSEPGISYNSYYSGDVNSLGQRHGWGVQMYMDGVAFYTCGKWHQDKMIQRRPVPLDHLIWKISAFQQRAFEQSPHGLLFQDDGIYEGEIDRTEMLPHGYGTLRLIMGDPATYWIQRGEFHLGVLHGADCLVQSEDDIEMYRGEMKMGVRDGFGSYRKGTELQHTGEWRDGQIK